MIAESEVLHVTAEKKTLGGDTFWIQHEDWPGEERALCYRKIRPFSQKDKGYPADSRCNNQAGWGTSHFGEGACKNHGGSDKKIMERSSNGAVKTVFKTQLRRKIEEYIESGDRDSMLDLTYELAAIRVLFQDLLEQFPDPEDKTYTIQVNRAINMIQATGSLVDKISRIQTRSSITAAQVMYLRATVADILAKHITEIDQRERAIKELMARVGGGEGDEETRMVAI